MTGCGEGRKGIGKGGGRGGGPCGWWEEGGRLLEGFGKSAHLPPGIGMFSFREERGR